MNILKLKEILTGNNQPKFRLEQIKKAVYQDGISDFAEITNIPKDLREGLKKEISILSLEPSQILASKDKRSVKSLLKLEDGNLIETVLISPKPGDWSVCVSSQVGCPLGCGFCATGRGGFKRNLTSEEITDQVLFWRQYLAKGSKGPIGLLEPRISNIVFMGMGEPFLNWENVRQSLKDLTDPDLFDFGSRAISVSTAGVPEGIEKLAREFPQVNLALSLHFATDEQRSRFMPINKKYNLTELRSSLRDYFAKCNRQVFMEYIMLENINDSREDADNLIKYLKSMGKLQLIHVNLIRYNATSDELKPSEAGVVREFRDYLLQNGISATIRKSLGADIQGACGQLAGARRK
jgi:23S rRNA (adenine(2503)-C(2))-methyltransferase